MANRSRKYLYITATVIVLISGYFILSKKNAEAPASSTLGNKIVVEDKESVPAGTGEKLPADKPMEKPIRKLEILPNKILIDVPFTSQAPFAVWDAYHEEACEEASLIMVKYYLDKKKLTPDIAEKEIQKMIAFEIKKYGDYKDTTAAETAKLADDFYPEFSGSKNLKVIYDFKKEDLKKYLAQGRPIIIPAAGRLLGNPNFKVPGPLYHNLVLIGYDGNAIITNDPGTRKGQGYAYDIDTLYNAIHDFPGQPENIAQGRKAMIVLE